MAFNRAKQWTTFARVWYLFDAKWQDPSTAGQVISKYLLGKHKPIFSITGDCGDYVVVINSKKISLDGDMWRTFKFFHHTGYSQGATYTPAWKYHLEDPTRIIKATTKNEMPNKLYRGHAMSRLIVFPDDKVPESILKNVTEQMQSVNQVILPLHEYSKEEVEKFPRLFEWPKDYVINDLKGAYGDQPTITTVKTGK